MGKYAAIPCMKYEKKAFTAFSKESQRAPTWSCPTEGLLGTDLMVVGTNAFIAYELAYGARFPTGNEKTEDFNAVPFLLHSEV